MRHCWRRWWWRVCECINVVFMEQLQIPSHHHYSAQRESERKRSIDSVVVVVVVVDVLLVFVVWSEEFEDTEGLKTGWYRFLGMRIRKLLLLVVVDWW